jgi:hypothetical protein
LTREAGAWPQIRFTPEASDAFCRDFGLTRAEAEAMLAENNALLAVEWDAYRAVHPGATLRDFAMHQLEEAAFGIAVDAGVPRGHARRLAREARARAEAGSS